MRRAKLISISSGRRAKLIRDKVGPNQSHYPDQDEIEIRVIDGDGWIQKVEVSAMQSEVRLAVTVDGLRISPGQVILKDESSLYVDQQVVGPGTVTFQHDPDLPPLLIFIVANSASGELDRARYAPVPSPRYSSSPHVREVERQQVEGKPKPLPETPTSGVEFKAPLTSKDKKQAPKKKASSPKVDPDTNRRTSKPTEVEVLRVVMVSPGDVVKERACLPSVIEELNKGLAGELGLRLEPWGWETDTYPDFHAEGPQGQVDQSMNMETADIVIGVFWQRFGTPVADAKSGTEHELLRARDARQKSGSKPHIMIDFNQQARNLKSTAEIDQYRAVHEFKERVSQEGLWWSYRGSKEFETLVRRHLQQLLREWYGQV